MLYFDADRPDKTDELLGKSGDDLAGGFAPAREAPVATVQAFLGTPGDGGDLWWKCFFFSRRCRRQR